MPIMPSTSATADHSSRRSGRTTPTAPKVATTTSHGDPVRTPIAVTTAMTTTAPSLHERPSTWGGCRPGMPESS